MESFANMKIKFSLIHKPLSIFLRIIFFGSLFLKSFSQSVCIDTTEKGYLSQCSLLLPYKLSGEFSRFGNDGK